jgi:hypothetical protein
MKTSSSELELLQQKVAALEARDAALEARDEKLAVLEARMAQLCPQLEPTANGTDFASVTDRRGMMKKMAGLAVGVAAAGLLKPSRALADDGNPLTFGSITTGASGNSQTSAARFVYNGAAVDGALFLFEDGTAYAPGDDAVNAVLAGLAANGPGGADVGVHGFSNTASGIGVFAVGTGANSIGVRGQALLSGGTGGVFIGDRAALALSLGGGAVADPNAGVTGGTVGDVYRGSSDGGLWYKAGGSVPYCRLADSTTAGALTAFASSSRFVNTITGNSNTYAGQHLNGGATATYQIGGVTVSGNTVPANARAIIGRIADPNPAGPGGNILVGATNPPVGGVIAIVAGAPQNSSFISALDASGNLYVKNTSPSGSTDIIIDIQGYYL